MPTRRRRFGQSLLELVCASGVISVALVPALRLMRDSLHADRDLEYSNQLTTLATSKLEQALALANVVWQTGAHSGDFASEGYPRLRWTVSRSDQPADGGLVDRLLAVQVTAWDDLNGDGALSDGERKVSLATKIARLVSYEEETKK